MIRRRRSRRRLKPIVFIPIIVAIVALIVVLVVLLTGNKPAAVKPQETPAPDAQITPAPEAPVVAAARLYPYKAESVWGYKDQTGNILILPQFTSAGEFSEGFAVVSVLKDGTERFGVINTEGELITEAIYQKVMPFSSGMAAIQVADAWGYMDTEGIIRIEPEYTAVGAFAAYDNVKLARVSKDGKWGYVNDKGEKVIQPQYDKANDFAEGLAIVSYKDPTGVYRYEIIDVDGQTVSAIGDSEGTGFSQGRAVVKLKNGQHTYISRRGVAVFTDTYSNALNFSENYAAVKKDGKWGFIDMEGTMVIAPTYDDAGSFSEGLAPVKLDGKWGYIDAAGTMIITNRYDQVSSFVNGYASVRQNNNICSMSNNNEYKQIYVIEEQTELTRTATVKVSSGSVRLRKGPSTDTEEVTALSDGTKVVVLGAEGEWSNVDYNGVVGYVKTEFLVMDE